MTQTVKATETAVATTAKQGQVVIYHAPGGEDFPALVLHVIDGTAYLLPFIQDGDPKTEGTDVGQFSALA